MAHPQTTPQWEEPLSVSNFLPVLTHTPLPSDQKSRYQHELSINSLLTRLTTISPPFRQSHQYLIIMKLCLETKTLV